MNSMQASCLVAILALAAVAQAQEPEKQLKDVEVQADAEHANGPIVGIVPKRSATATKTDTPLIETPQSITVISADRFRAQGAQSVQDAVRYTPGVFASPYGEDSRGDWTIMRGSEPTQYHDGLQELFLWNNNVRPDPFTLERVEVLRGPSGTLYGQGSIAGVINLVSKRPSTEQQSEIQLQVGSYSRKQLGLDITGPLDAEKKWSYRLISVQRDSENYVKHVEDKRMLVSPAITWRPNADTSLTVLANMQRDKFGTTVAFLPWVGSIYNAPNGRVPSDLFMGEPDFDRYNTDQDALSYFLDHRLSSTWVLRQNFRYSSSKGDYQNIYPKFPPTLNPDNTTIERVYYVAKPEVKAVVVDTQAQADWAVGGSPQKTLFGIDYQSAVVKSKSAYGDATPLDVYNPVYGSFDVTPELSSEPKNTLVQTGLYVQNQSRFHDAVILTLGLRQDTAESTIADAPDAGFDEDALTKRLGVSWLLAGGWAPYASYSESFLPLAGTDAAGEAFKPQEGQQVEAGVKFQPADGSVLMNFAVYELSEKNRQTADPNDPNNSLQTGEVAVRGAEFEVSANLAAKTDVIFTYSHTKSEITKSNNGDEGKRIASIPEKLGSLWFSQGFAVGGFDGFKVAAGARYVGDSWDGMDGVKTPAVTLYDAMVSFEQKGFNLAVNGTNLTDKEHVATCLARGDCFWGSPRLWNITGSYRF